MRRSFIPAAVTALLLTASAPRAQQKKALDAYFVDVEGGQATLFVSPSGQSLLVDTGWPGTRDSGRIAEVAKTAGISQIDYLVLTHYHADHAGGVVDLASRIPIRNFVDHGPPQEEVRNVPQMYTAYLGVREKGQHILAKPGDKIPISGIDVQIVSSAGETIAKPLPGAGAPNPLCADFKAKDEVADPLVGGENKASVGMVISLGRFRLADFGDLTWNKEHDLACPNNLIGIIDVYVVSHHGQDISSLPMLVHAMRPRVAIMDNGANKGGAETTFNTLWSSPGLHDIWQLHYSVNADGRNAQEQFIANLGTDGTAATGVPDETTANYIQLIAQPDGSFNVINSRNKCKKHHPTRGYHYTPLGVVLARKLFSCVG